MKYTDELEDSRMHVIEEEDLNMKVIIKYKIKKANDLTFNEVFDPEAAVLILLSNYILYLDSFWDKRDWPEDAREVATLFVDCSHSFGKPEDKEPVYFNDIEMLYNMWKADPVWGTTVWTAIKRKLMPIPEIVASIKEEGIWNLIEMVDVEDQPAYKDSE
jgi:hypothetical protein